MGNWSSSFDNEKRYVVFEEDDIHREFNGVAFGMLLNNSIPGLIPCSVTQTDNKRYVTFNVSSYQNFRDHLEKETTFDFVSALFLDICTSIVKLRKYMIGLEDIILDFDKMYVDPYAAEMKFMINPVLNESSVPDCKAFFRNIIVNLKLSGDDSRHIGAILSMLNKKDFTIEKFLDDLKKQDTVHSADSREFRPSPSIDLPVRKAEEKTVVTPNTALRGDIPMQPSPVQQKITKDAVVHSESEDNNAKNGLWLGKLFSKKKQNGNERASAMAGLAIPGHDNIGVRSFSVSAEPHSDSDATVIESGDDATDIISETKIYPKLVNRSTGAAVSIDRDTFRIGRDPALNLDFVISSKQVSHHHATIKLKRNFYCIVDENSTNHTYVNGKRILSGSDFRLGNGDIIKIGSEEFVFEI